MSAYSYNRILNNENDLSVGTPSIDESQEHNDELKEPNAEAYALHIL